MIPWLAVVMMMGKWWLRFKSVGGGGTEQYWVTGETITKKYKI